MPSRLLSRHLPPLPALLRRDVSIESRFDVFAEPRRQPPADHRSVMPAEYPRARPLRRPRDRDPASRCGLLARKGHDESSDIYCDWLPAGHGDKCDPFPTAERLRLAWGTDFVGASRRATGYVGRHRL